jgi:site-specific DNA-methyltransferase (adenine-specific)
MSVRPERFQLLPELDPESFAALKVDIAERGVIVPVLVDEFGTIIDGHNRSRACRELGINDYPVEVRSGLGETEKRTLARKLNVLRRHLTRDQVRQLIADQLRDTPEWADRRISRELGVDHKTVGTVRTDLSSTGEIPQLEKTVGDDGKSRPAKQGRRKRKALTLNYDPQTDDWSDDWDDDDRPQERRVDAWNDPTRRAKFHHAADLIRLGVDPNSDQVDKLIRESAVCVIENTGYRIFAHCTSAGERDWHLFILFLTREWNWHPEGAGYHVEYLSQKQFMDPDEWLGEEGERFRRRSIGGVKDISEEFKQAWTSFKQANSSRTQAEIIAEIEAIYQERGPFKWGAV